MIIDIHTHILPGVDDGAAALEESLEMLRLQRQAGVERLYLTPHFYPRYETPETFLDKRNASETALRKVLMQEKDCDFEKLIGQVASSPANSEDEDEEEETPSFRKRKSLY